MNNDLPYVIVEQHHLWPYVATLYQPDGVYLRAAYGYTPAGALGDLHITQPTTIRERWK